MQNLQLKSFYEWLLARPKATLVSGLLLLVLIASQLPHITKDTGPEAFMAKDNPARVYREHVRQVFGLKDPMVIAIEQEGPNGVFTPEILRDVVELTRQVQALSSVDGDKVLSFATENDIRGHADGLEVMPFLDPLPTALAEADQLWQRVQQFPAYLGTLVSRDGKMTLIEAELRPEAEPRQAYLDLLALTRQFKTSGGETFHVAGQGAITGYLSAYIDADAKRLNPLSAVIITLLLFIAYRTWRATLLPNVVVLATVATSLGAMAAFGVPFYVITNSLPVILIGIAVADSIHIFGQYYEEVAQYPKANAVTLLRQVMSAQFRPVTLTSVTTVAGFVGLAITSDMPPVQAYGWFAALGVVMAWCFSVAVLPAALVLLSPQLSPAMSPKVNQGNARQDPFSRVMSALGHGVYAAPRITLGLIFGLLVLAVFGASQLQMNERRVENFRHSEPLYIADQAMNQRMDGTYYLDIAVTTPTQEGLLQPERLKAIEALQTFLAAQPEIQGSTSVVDYLKQIHKSIHGDDAAAYRLPDSEELAAQLLLLYSTSGDPTDFQEEIDSEYRQALVRAYLPTDEYTVIAPLVQRVQHYLSTQFNSNGLKGEATGAVALSASWLAPLQDSHFKGVAVSLLLVFGTSILFFRSVVLGLLATIPVVGAVLLIYAVMGLNDIWLGIGTSMFASIAIGLGVDFAIHTLDRFRYLLGDQGVDFATAFQHFFASTGRALLFNLAALLFGFGVLMFSSVPPLQHFGLLVAVAVFSSFVLSVTLIPAWLRLRLPRALRAIQSDSSELSSEV